MRAIDHTPAQETQIAIMAQMQRQHARDEFTLVLDAPSKTDVAEELAG